MTTLRCLRCALARRVLVIAVGALGFTMSFHARGQGSDVPPEENADASAPDTPPEASPDAGPLQAPATTLPPPSLSPPSASGDLPPSSPPAQRFRSAGSVLVSADEALPLLSVGSVTPLTGFNGLQVGDPGGYDAPAWPRPIFLDLVFGYGITVGGTLVLEVPVDTPRSSLGNVRHLRGVGRIGFLVPLGDKLAAWGRVGMGYAESSTDTSRASATRGDLILDLRLAWVLRRSALLAGPTITIPFESAEPSRPDLVRLGLAVGMTARFGGDPEEPSARPNALRVLVGVDHIASFVHVRSEVTRQENVSADTERGATTVGTTDTLEQLPVAPRAALDLAFASGITIGGAANIGYARTTAKRHFLPQGDAPSTFVVGLLPRLGYVLRLNDWISLWGRAGPTFVASSSNRALGSQSSWHIGSELDGLLVLSAGDAAIAFGPWFAIPFGGSRDSRVRNTLAGQEGVFTTTETLRIYQGGLTASLLITL
jgi:hypothetical protein